MQFKGFGAAMRQVGRGGFRALFAGALLWAAALLANAAPLASGPVFALDGEAHAGRSFVLAATPDQRYLVTAAYDKSVRVWDAETGALVRRMVVPVANPGDGQLAALALSPDGNRLALAGLLLGFGQKHAALVVSLKDGKVLKALTGFSHRTNAVAWSPDGNLLAVGIDAGDNPGELQVFQSGDWKKVFEDTVQGRTSVIAFRQNNDFFASSHNGNKDSVAYFYRFNGSGFDTAGQRGLGNRGGWRGMWSKDEKTFTVGGHSRFDGEQMAEVNDWVARGSKRPSAEKFLHLRESADGRQLIGAAWVQFGKAGKVRRWAGLQVDGRFDEAEIPDTRVADILPLRNGNLAYLTEDGGLPQLDPALKLRWRQAAAVVKLLNRPEQLKLSADGDWVSLPLSEGDDSRRMAFNLRQPRFANEAGIAGGWHAAETTRGDLRVENWRDSNKGSVNGFEFPKTANRERSLSVALHASERGLVVGTAFGSVRRLDGEGRQLWVRHLRADVSAVQVNAAHDEVLAYTEDGLLRVLRWSDGVPLITYVLQPAQRKWLAIADNGFYEAGVGAEDLAGWVVNRGRARMADFVPLSRFRERFLLSGLLAERWHAPNAPLRDVAIAALEKAGRKAQAEQLAAAGKPREQAKPASEDVSDIIAAAAKGEAPVLGDALLQSLPPTVQILSGLEVVSRERKVSIRYQINTPPDAPVTRVSSRVISASQSTRGLQPKRADSGEAAEISVDIPPENAEIQLVAENKWGVSPPASIRVRYEGAATSGGARRGRLHIIAVGVSDYDNPDYRLGLAAKDARDFGDTLRPQKGGFYSDVSLLVLTDKSAGKNAVEAAVRSLQGKVQPEDTTMLFLAGHGINDASGEYLYLPKDANLDRLRETGVSFRLIRDTLASLPGRTLMFVDTCHAGNAVGKLRQGQRTDPTAAINELASSENNIIVFASSTGAQQSLENADWGNGAFTKALVEGLRGEADVRKRGRVSYKQLDAYVAERVDDLTRGAQTPVTPVLQGVPDFTVVEIARPR